MPNFAGTWKMRSSENFDELLKALGKPRAPWGAGRVALVNDPGTREAPGRQMAARSEAHPAEERQAESAPRESGARWPGAGALSPTAPPLSRAGSSRGAVTGDPGEGQGL